MPGWRSSAPPGSLPGPIRSVDRGGDSESLAANGVTNATAISPREGEAFPLGLSPKPVAHRYEALDSLRGICALLVCLFHFRANSPLVSLPFIRGSWLFVDFFFVLSGFVIAANYRQRLINGGFLRGFVILRFGRVYPLHLVMLLVYIAMELVGVVMVSRGAVMRPMFDSHHSVASIFTNLTFTQSFGLHDGLTWNQPSWSIAVEFWTYLLFALAARRGGEGLERWLVVAIIASIAILAVVTPYGINVTYSWSLVRCVYGFAVGAIIWRIWQQSGKTPDIAYPGATWIELAAVAAVVAFVSLCGDTLANLAAPLVFGAAVLVFARGGGAIAKLLLAAPLKTLGVLSFSIYMVHAFVQARFDDVLGVIGRRLHVELLTSKVGAGGEVMKVVGTTPLQGTLLTLVMLAVVVGVSQLTWRLVELPGQRLARRLAKKA
jgi:peptidoglycan/LPS O-acetylase OafA/YrhL